MYQTLTCLVYEHDHRLVALAAAMCVIGAATCLRVLQIAFRSDGILRFAWLAAAALAGGGSVWSTHFIAMIAYDPGIVVGYATWPIFASFAAALVMPGAGFTVYLLDNKWAPWAAGALLGLGIAALHYVGMTGVILPATIVWDPVLVAASIGFSVVLSIVAMFAIQKLSGGKAIAWGTAALSSAVVLLHFTGMGALTVLPDYTIPTSVYMLSTPALAAAAIIVNIFILAIAFVCIAFDRKLANDQASAAQQIAYMEYYDGLTTLPNRAQLIAAMPRMLADAAERGQEMAALAIDIDRFKQVNDIFGHQTGDALLRVLADAMKAQLGPSDMLARVGGDEFVVLQSGIPQPQGAEMLAKRILDAVCGDVLVGSHRLRASASIGIALYPRDGRDASTLHGNADSALFRAKQDGRGMFRLFEPEMDLASRRRLALQGELRDALQRNEFKLYYQPQAETLTGVICGFEALLRWEHPVRGLVPPGEFIAAAEENGFIMELGEFVLRTACAEAASWDLPLAISVNLSPVQFRHGDLTALIAEILETTGLDPQRLELEITESVLIHDTARALETLMKIKALGVCVAMDDFGTGYSSLAYLQAFPFDRIKIDRSFVAGLDNNPQSQVIIRAIVSLGRGLNVPITAEGVETEEQQAFLAELYCDEVQGYLVGHPQPIELLQMHVRRAKDHSSRRAVA